MDAGNLPGPDLRQKHNHPLTRLRRRVDIAESRAHVPGDCVCGEEHSAGGARVLGIGCTVSLQVTARFVAVLCAGAPAGILVSATARDGLSGPSRAVFGALLFASLVAPFAAVPIMLVPWHRLSPPGVFLVLLIVAGGAGRITADQFVLDGQPLVGPVSEIQFAVAWPMVFCAFLAPWILAPLHRRNAVHPWARSGGPEYLRGESKP